MSSIFEKQENHIYNTIIRFEMGELSREAAEAELQCVKISTFDNLIRSKAIIALWELAMTQDVERSSTPLSDSELLSKEIASAIIAAQHKVLDGHWAGVDIEAIINHHLTKENR